MRQKTNAFSVLVTGLGGQGVLLLSKVIATAASGRNAFSCRTESRGLSQRGGSVCSEVRFGPDSVAPVIGRGGADLILSIDALEASRVLDFLKPDGVLLTNSQFIAPLHVLSEWSSKDCEEEEHAAFDQRLRSIFTSYREARTVDLFKLAESVQCERALNCVLLGIATQYLPIAVNEVRAALIDHLKPQHREGSLRAFNAGMSVVPLSPFTEAA
jgi:indolepyruvate ferredoxin oxidoreductase beta subunit